MSCTRRASVVVPAGTAVHARGGDWLAPSHVYWRGMAPPSANAELVSWMRVAGCADAAVVVDFVALSPLEPQAIDVTRSPRASLRSTSPVLPQQGGKPRPSNLWE